MTSVELELTGMTCASCANRIERKLNKVPGVIATVNYATEKAKVTHRGRRRHRRPDRGRRGGRVRRGAARPGRDRTPRERARRPDSVCCARG